MTKASINTLFSEERINELPSWRFILHFESPIMFKGKAIQKASDLLKRLSLTVTSFETDLNKLKHDRKSGCTPIHIIVTEDKRQQSNALQHYQDDFKKIHTVMLECGFGGLFYEAVDWRDIEKS